LLVGSPLDADRHRPSQCSTAGNGLTPWSPGTPR
jgi:hypothetical protein